MSHDPLIGQRLGNYILRQQVGVGGMGVVYRADHCTLRRSAAVKVLSDRHSNSSDAQQYKARFRREAEALARLDHPNIVRVFEADLDGDRPWIAMQLIRPVRTLYKAQKPPRSLPDALDILSTIADALHYAHTMGIIHRDLKPHNILVDSHGTLYVSDFGIARVAGATHLTATGMILGSPQYMSPEQARGEVATKASDIYSLGVIAYELAVGRPPFSASEPLALLNLHASAAPDMSPVPLPFVPAITACLSKNPATRFETPLLFVEALRAGLGVHSTTVAVRRDKKPVPGDTRFDSWLRKWREEQGLPPFIEEGVRCDSVIGNSAIINSAFTNRGYTQVKMSAVAFPESGFNSALLSVATEWQAELHKNEQHDGIKTAPVRVTFPTTDDETLYIEHARLAYKVIRAFHMLVGSSKKVRRVFLPHAFRLQDTVGRVLPGAVAVDVAVVLKGRELLLGHRVYRKGGYYPQTWSASLEEHFCPTPEFWGGREHSADADLGTAAWRGFREEYAGLSFEQSRTLTMQATSVDLVNLNCQTIAVLEVPTLTFDEILERWRDRDDTPDAGEHDVIATIPLERAILQEALVSGVPGNLVKRMSETASTMEVLSHSWHPRSLARIACCLWMLEQDGLS